MPGKTSFQDALIAEGYVCVRVCVAILICTRLGSRVRYEIAGHRPLFYACVYVCLPCFRYDMLESLTLMSVAEIDELSEGQRHTIE